eukprot:m.182766 g.182766  ORF g.182766 m.182766 type:complete len:116 (-) comp15382_c1_seq2:119-466(-)
MILSASGNGLFTFRDLVAWWTQSSRNWLFLLDDDAFRKRNQALEVFQRHDGHRVGKVSDEQFSGLIRGLRNAEITTKSEEVVRKGLDPTGKDMITLNDYINWLAHMGIIHDRVPA